MKLRLLMVAATLAAFAARDGRTAAESQDTTGTLQEVTVTAQRLNLNWGQRNALVQQVASFVYGITALENEEGLARWNTPICPFEKGLAKERGQFVIERFAQIVHTVGAPLGHVGCHPNLFIFVTTQPQELLRLMEQHHFAVSFGNSTPSQVDQFIAEPGPVWVWRNVSARSTGNIPFIGGRPPDSQVLGGGSISAPTYNSPGAMGASRLPSAVWSFDPVFVVVDQARMHGVTLEQFTDYVAMVSLAQIKLTPHFGEAQTILKLFDSSSQSAPAAMSDWDQSFLQVLYHPEVSLAKEQSTIALRMVRALVPR